MNTGLLDRLLPHLAQNRERWPLWTYERRRVGDELTLPGPGRSNPDASWHGCLSWPERLAWSSLVRTREIHRALAGALEGWGLVVDEWTPGQAYAFGTIGERAVDPSKVLRRDGDRMVGDPRILSKLGIPKNRMICFDPDHFPDIGVEIPRLLHLEAQAVVAQYSVHVPPTEVEVGELEYAAELLDPPDRQELAETILRTLFVPRWTGPQQDEGTLFVSVLQRAVEGTWGEELSSKELRAELGGRLLEAAGLVPYRAGGRKQSIGDARLLGLYEEAVEAVGTIGAAELTLPVLEPVADLAREDARFSRRDVERVYRVARLGPVDSPLFNAAIRLHFPFLQASEVSAIRATDRKETDKELARRLVMDRLPRYDAADDDRSFEALLSSIRTGR